MRKCKKRNQCGFLAIAFCLLALFSCRSRLNIKNFIEKEIAKDKKSDFVFSPLPLLGTKFQFFKTSDSVTATANIFNEHKIPLIASIEFPDEFKDLFEKVPTLKNDKVINSTEFEFKFKTETSGETAIPVQVILRREEDRREFGIKSCILRCNNPPVAPKITFTDDAFTISFAKYEKDIAKVGIRIQTGEANELVEVSGEVLGFSETTLSQKVPVAEFFQKYSKIAKSGLRKCFVTVTDNVGLTTVSETSGTHNYATNAQISKIVIEGDGIINPDNGSNLSQYEISLGNKYTGTYYIPVTNEHRNKTGVSYKVRYNESDLSRGATLSPTDSTDPTLIKEINFTNSSTEQNLEFKVESEDKQSSNDYKLKIVLTNATAFIKQLDVYKPTGASANTATFDETKKLAIVDISYNDNDSKEFVISQRLPDNISLYAEVQYSYDNGARWQNFQKDKQITVQLENTKVGSYSQNILFKVRSEYDKLKGENKFTKYTLTLNYKIESNITGNEFELVVDPSIVDVPNLFGNEQTPTITLYSKNGNMLKTFSAKDANKTIQLDDTNIEKELVNGVDSYYVTASIGDIEKGVCVAFGWMINGNEDPSIAGYTSVRIPVTKGSRTTIGLKYNNNSHVTTWGEGVNEEYTVKIDDNIIDYVSNDKVAPLRLTNFYKKDSEKSIKLNEDIYKHIETLGITDSITPLFASSGTDVYIGDCSIILPPALKALSQKAFKGMSGLEEVQFSNDFKGEIDGRAFESCHKLNKISMPQKNSYSVGDYRTDEKGNLLKKIKEAKSMTGAIDEYAVVAVGRRNVVPTIENNGSEYVISEICNYALYHHKCKKVHINCEGDTSSNQHLEKIGKEAFLITQDQKYFSSNNKFYLYILDWGDLLPLSSGDIPTIDGTAPTFSDDSVSPVTVYIVSTRNGRTKENWEKDRKNKWVAKWGMSPDFKKGATIEYAEKFE
ncbi:MAG: leucine-rich repeat protein [Treponemataceae bacterium]